MIDVTYSEHEYEQMKEYYELIINGEMHTEESERLKEYHELIVKREQDIMIAKVENLTNENRRLKEKMETKTKNHIFDDIKTICEHWFSQPGTGNDEDDSIILAHRIYKLLQSAQQ